MTEKIYRAAKAEEVLTLAGLCAAAYPGALWVKTDVQRMTAFWRAPCKGGAFQWVQAPPATAPAGSKRSSHGGNEVAEAFD